MAKVTKTHLILGVVILLHVFLLTRILFFPYPELMVYSYLTDMGMIPYSQIFDQHFPGIMFFPINLASLGINDPGSLRLVHLILISINHIIIFKISEKLFKSPRNALIVNFLYLLYQPFYEGYVLWIESFVAPLILSSFYYLLTKEKKHQLISGVLLGAALLFKQVVLPLILLITIYLFYKKYYWKHFVIGIGAVTLLLIWFVLYYSNLTDFIYWTYTFNVTTFSEMGRKSAELGQLIQTVPLFSPILFALFFLTLSYLLPTKKINIIKNDSNISLILFMVGTLAFAFARFDYIHLQPLIPFVMITLAMFLLSNNKLISVLTLTGIIFSSIYLLPNFYKINSGKPTPFFGEFEQDLVSAVEKYSNEDDSVFAMATTPHIYYLANRMPPGDVFVFQFPWFMVEVEDELLNGIEADPPTVVLRDQNASVQGLNLVSYMPEIDSYIQENYQVVDEIEGIEIMIKN